MNKKQINMLISWIAVFLWMILIFNLSSQVAEQSDHLSTGITEIIIRTINKVIPNINFDISNHIVRKNAHFFIYLILGMLAVNALRRSKVVGDKSIALLICFLYAILDELHQFYVPGRGPGVKDIFIDSAGATVGILLYLAISRINKRVITNRKTCNESSNFNCDRI
ncbi:MAG: VanZ family protein [Clostridiaceae bacterium]